MTDIRIEHGDDWMSISISKRIVAIKPDLAIQPFAVRGMGFEPIHQPFFSRRYRRAVRPGDTS